MTEFLIHDVFSSARFGGNQLAIFPDASDLAEADLQSIAREFNFSETTFVYPPSDPAHSAKVRIFTPTMEIPFAGHPVIGTAVALSSLGHGPDMTLELGVGPLSCHAAGGSARFTTTAPLERLASPDPALVASALGLSVDQIDTAAHAPIMASLGLAFTITRLTSRAALASATPDAAAFRTGRDLYPSSLDFAQFAYFADASGLIHARMFAPLDNIPEDPATGSACAALAALLAQEADAPLTLNIQQGFDMGRPSEISLSARPGSVDVSGQSVAVMTGQLL